VGLRKLVQDGGQDCPLGKGNFERASAGPLWCIGTMQRWVCASDAALYQITLDVY